MMSELKFGIYIEGHLHRSCIDIGEYRTNSSFLSGIQEIIAEMSVKKFLVFVFLSVCDAIMVAEIIRFAWNLAQMFVCYAKLAV